MPGAVVTFDRDGREPSVGRLVSPVIILGLVLMWGIVLVPMWLRRHDEAEETRSVDRFSTAMRTLSRRESRADSRYVVMPHRSRAIDVHVSGAAVAEPAGASARPGRPGAASRPAPSAAARRRRTLLGLLIATVLTMGLAVLAGSVFAWLPQILVDLCLVAFVAHLRIRARQAAAVTRQRRRAAVAPAREVVPTDAPMTSPAPDWSLRVPEYEAPEYEASEYEAPAWGPEVAEQAGAAVERETVAADPAEVEPAAVAGWEPVPVPRPTYTMKPPAPARRRRSVPLADDSPAAYAEPVVPEPEDIAAEEPSILDDILTHRWAVND